MEMLEEMLGGNVGRKCWEEMLGGNVCLFSFFLKNKKVVSSSVVSAQLGKKPYGQGRMGLR